MSEEEYWENESEEEFESEEEDSREFGDTFLSGEEASGNINMIMIPDLSFDCEVFLRGYLKMLSKCATNDEGMGVLRDLFEQVQLITTIENETDELHMRAESLNLMMQNVKIM